MEGTMRNDQDGRPKASRGTWERPTLKTVGTVGEILRGGGGKLSLVADDTGDIRKPKGLEG
jgi:hypothetical protein